MKYSFGRQLFGYDETPKRSKNDNTEAVVPQAQHKKLGFFGKDRTARKNRGQQERRRTKYEVD